MLNTSDKQYQATEQYLPDKESTWSYPSNKDGWVHAHNALRGEMNDIKDILQAMEDRSAPLQEWETTMLQKILSLHFDHIHSHHSNEDDVFVPELRKRINFPIKLVDDHIGLVKKLQELECILNSLKVGTVLRTTALLQEWINYQTMMLPHLQEEEDIALPLMRAYYTPNDITPIVQKVVAKGPKIEMGSFIYYMGIDQFRNEFMKQENIPFFVWYIDFNTKYKYFLKEFKQNMDALRMGVQPPEPKPWFRFPLFSS